MLGQRRRRLANIETALGEIPVFAGKVRQAVVEFVFRRRQILQQCSTKFLKHFIDRLHVNFDISVIFISLFFFVRFLYAARIGYTFGCHDPMYLNSLGHCICEHQGKISAAAGFEPGTPRL